MVDSKVIELLAQVNPSVALEVIVAEGAGRKVTGFETLLVTEQPLALDAFK